MPASAFYDAEPLAQLAINLFYGWGYNFYRVENQLRADDQVVRAKVGWLLGRARASVDAAESAWRHEFLPPPSRAKPYPDATAVAGAQKIEKLAHAIGALAGQIGAQPVPAQDRMTELYRQEEATLARLIDIDQRLVGQAELLRSLVEQKDGAWIIANLATLQDGLTALGETLTQRQAVLL
jgi:hypothetical protein